MKCPECGCEFKNPLCVSGGSAKVPKGFASREVLEKALATRKRNKLKRS